jgi:hypothetical protein
MNHYLITLSASECIALDVMLKYDFAGAVKRYLQTETAARLSAVHWEKHALPG